MTYCPRAACFYVGTEIVNDVAFCARHATEERMLLAARPKRPDPFGLSGARQLLTKIIPRVLPVEVPPEQTRITFNDLGEPTELQIGPYRYRVFPRGVE